MTNIICMPPEECTDMAQVREGVDATDAALIKLLMARFAYMNAAARIKTDRHAVRDEARKAQVINNVVSMAKEAGLPVQDVAAIWELLVESSIAYETHQWDTARVQKTV